MPASLIVLNADLHTMDPARPRARALAVDGETILAVGDESDVADLRGATTQVLDLSGRTAVPGLIDAHVHLLMFGHSLGGVSLYDASSIDEAAARVRRFRTERPEAEWITGNGWDPNLWPRWPTRADLDQMVADRPVALWSHDHHSLWVNSAALARAGIGAGAAQPDGGLILLDESGVPNGILQERAAELILAAIPEPTAAEHDDAIRRAIGRANALGLTGVHVVEGADSLAAIQRVREAGGRSLRILAAIPRSGFDAAVSLGLRTGLGDDWLRLGGVKLFADGALGSQTAWMFEPYLGQGGNRGVAVLDAEELRTYAERAAASGIALTVHAIGDRANHEVLDAIQRARAIDGGRLRHRIEHAQVLHPDDVARFAALGVVASVQPTHATSDMHTADHFWGDRCHTSYAWRSLLDAGARVAFGSDCPVEPIDPLPGIHAAVTRQRADGTPDGGWYPEQRVTVTEAVHAFTMGAAFAAGEESRKGSLTPGKVADLTVLSHDIFTIPPSEILGTRVVATLVGGRVVYEAALAGFDAG